MAGFLYFRSGDTRPMDRQQIDELQLGYAFDRRSEIESRELRGETPSGQAGVLFCDARRQHGRAATYDAQQQVWARIPLAAGRQELYAGFWLSARPTPADLARDTQLPGAGVRLADGETWLIPCVRDFDEQTGDYVSQLPAYLAVDDSGNVTRGRVVAAYRQLWEETLPLVDEKILGGDHGEQAVLQGVVALLRANYHVSAIEISAAELVADDETIGVIAIVASNFRRFQKWLTSLQDEDEEGQKKSPEFPPTLTGSASSVGAAG